MKQTRAALDVANEITAVARFHGYTDVVEPQKMSVPIRTIRPSSYIPGRVFLHMASKAEADRCVVGRSYQVVINTANRTCRLLGL